MCEVFASPKFTNTALLDSKWTVFWRTIHSMIRPDFTTIGLRAVSWIDSFWSPCVSTTIPVEVTLTSEKRLPDTLTYLVRSPKKTQPFSKTGDSCKRSNWCVSFATVTGRSFRMMGKSDSTSALGPNIHPDFTASSPCKQSVGLADWCHRWAAQLRLLMSKRGNKSVCRKCQETFTSMDNT